MTTTGRRDRDFLLLERMGAENLRLLREIAGEYDSGGAGARAAVKRFRELYAKPVSQFLDSIQAEFHVDPEACELGAQVCCTAVRLSEFQFPRERRVGWMQCFSRWRGCFREPGLAGRLLGNLGNAMAAQGQLADAHAVLQERHDLALRENDEHAVAFAKEHIGKLLLRQGKFSEAEPWLKDALHMARLQRREASIIRLLKDEAQRLFRAGDSEQGVAILEERLRRCEQSGDLLMQLSTHQFLAERHLEFDQLEDAERHANAAHGLAKSLDSQHHRATTSGTLGTIAFERGDFAKARELFRAARRIFHKQQFEAGLADTASSLGQTYVKLRSYPAAVRWLNESLSLNRVAGRLNQVAIDLDHLSRAFEIMYWHDDAVSALRERIKILDHLNEDKRAAEGRRTLERLEKAQLNKNHD